MKTVDAQMSRAWPQRDSSSLMVAKHSYKIPRSLKHLKLKVNIIDPIYWATHHTLAYSIYSAL